MIQLDNPLSDSAIKHPYRYCPKTIVTRAATKDDAKEITEFLCQFSEVSACEWQTEALTKSLIAHSTSIIRIAITEGKIIGVIMGGTMGSRATINHLAIDPLYQNIGIAHALFEQTKTALREQGIYRIFMFVNQSNQPGLQFWQKQGLRQTDGEVTLEMDI